MIYAAHKYEQHEQEFLSLVMEFNDINHISKVLVYGEDEYGYQRKLDKKHYMSIKNTLVKNSEILPTSIILSVNRNEIKDCIEEFDGIDPHYGLVKIDFPQKKVFRIVDGQHRLKGLEEAVKSNEIFYSFKLNVIILITDNENRKIEINVFKDINSKAKRIRTDLTQLAEHNYRILGQKPIETTSELIEHVSIIAAYYLNEEPAKETNKDEVFISEVWRNGIIFEINLSKSLGIIGVTPFINSINKITKEYLKYRAVPIEELNKKELINYADRSAFEIAQFLEKAWILVKEKWPKSFEERKVTSPFEKLVETYYDKAYYIQKTTGVSAINNLLYDCIQEYDFKFDEDTLILFEMKIKFSKIKEEDWGIGGIFSGLTSQSGFNKAQGYILNKLPEQK